MNNPSVHARDEREVCGLWVGPELPVIARLSIRSWLDHGIGFRLYAYDEVKGVPKGVVLADASAIIARKHVYTTEHGSLAPFSDWFRYTLLARRGGIWSDLDIAVLDGTQLPARDQWPWFARESDATVAIGLLAFEAGAAILAHMAALARDPAAVMPWDSADELEYKRMLRRDTPCAATRRRQARWSTAGPEGFTCAVRHFGLWESAAAPETIYPVYYPGWKYCFEEGLSFDKPPLDKAWALHLWHELIRRDPDALRRMHPQSIVAQLMRRHGVAAQE